jgi:SAM-dependent methyltransferase
MASITFSSPTHTRLARSLDQIAGQLSIVDYGCGEGELLHYLPWTKLKSYTGFEINPASLAHAGENWSALKKASFTLINKKKLPALGNSNSVDAVFLVGVIQYLPTQDLNHVLMEAMRVLKPGGKLLISCTTDHWVYQWLNIYRLFLPHFAINRQALLQKITQHGLKVKQQYERGLMLTPFFSNIFIFFFDALDKVFYHTKGELGPIGRKMRAAWVPIISREFTWNIDYGYTLFIEATKYV